MSLTIQKKLIVILIGIISGIIGPIVGGSGIIMVPLLLLFDIAKNQKEAVGTYMASTLSITGSPSIWLFYKANDIVIEAALLLMLSLSISIYFSTKYVIHRISNKLLYLIFIVYLVIMVILYSYKFMISKD